MGCVNSELNFDLAKHTLWSQSTDVVIMYLWSFQAKKEQDLGMADIEEEVKKRFKMVYVPNWFSVDLKTGVSPVN